MTLASAEVAAAYLAACRAELTALKPGNVHVFAAGHGMSVADFEASAVASAPALTRPGATVGERILGAIAATRGVVASNTNLGIVLLCAPLAQAAFASAPGALRDKLRQVLTALDIGDAELAFAAIRLANPGGLGDSAQHDVRRPATVSLTAAMAEAQDRDLVARQYATGFVDVFDIGCRSLREAVSRWGEESWAASHAYLTLLGRAADTHIARKLGRERAEAVRAEAAVLSARLWSEPEPAALTADLLAFDARFKAEGINPGATADITVASLFAIRLEDLVAAQ